MLEAADDIGVCDMKVGSKERQPAENGSTFASDVGMNSLESVRMQHHCHVISVVALGMATLTERREASVASIMSSQG